MKYIRQTSKSPESQMVVVYLEENGFIYLQLSNNLEAQHSLTQWLTNGIISSPFA